MSGKKYLAMCQVYEYEKDAEGKVDGKFQAFGAHGKVVSLYDSPGKAARYCGKDGYVAEMDPADCRAR